MARFLGLLIATLSVCLQAVLAQNAFSGAVGFGAIATGGNSGSTVHVTNLADSGTGSFRDAVSGSNRNIVFDVAGYIVLKSAVSLSSSITINGQTAPGGGIGLMGAEISASGKSNIIIRNLRMRQGTMDSDTGKSAFNMGDAKNVILDHCSFAYGQFDSIDAVGAVNITVSNSIIAFPIGQQFGAHVETGPSTFYGNLWVSAHNRQPLSKDNTQYVNNIVYNYQAAYTSANTGGYFSHDIINNYFIAGPSTSSAGDDYYQMDDKQSVYATGNFLDSNKDGALNGAAANSVGSAVVLSKPWASTSLGLATNSAAAAVTSVLANAGATPRDEVDTFAVNTVKSYGKSGTIYKSQADTGLSNGGYGTLTATSTKKAGSTICSLNDCVYS
ncbi:MAG: hypothetical protein Q9157_008452 [Trypethelium eluteriae]